jgi:hypothetical protein
LLNKLNPAYGVGLDVSEEMVKIAAAKYPDLTFVNSAIEDYPKNEDFDYVVISNLLEYVFDLYDFFFILKQKITAHTKIVITSINPLWGLAIKIATALGFRTPVKMNNFVTYKDIENIMSISGYEIIESGYRMFLPVRIPLVSCFLNKIVSRLPIIRNLCLLQYTIARPKQRGEIDTQLKCSVIVPCYNEQENIENCILSIPDLGDYTEIVVVNDGSADNTLKIIEGLKKKISNLTCVSYSPNKGKGHAVKQGLDAARGDILIILDADMAVLPEDLKKFYNVLASNQAEFVNGTRMIYGMVPGAMKFVNYLGNKAFGIMISFIIGQRNTDTLCGTKAFCKKDYLNFKMGRCPWGDFDLLFESSRMKLKMVEMPVHYYPRTAGKSKMKVIKHGIMLMRMCWYGFWYLD